MTAQKDDIILKALELAPAHGWSMDTLRMAAGARPQMADALFAGIDDATRHLSDLFDRRMMEQLENIDIEKMRVRDRIATAVRTRLDLMAPHRQALSVALAHWARPLRAGRAARALWRTADRIWTWAGDTATDYNHYTKRGLLSGVIASTTLYWLQDNSPAMSATRVFLDRRIENVLAAGKFLGSLKNRRAA